MVEMNGFDFEMMKEALSLAAKAGDLGEVPVGAVVVCAGEIIAKAHNLRESTQDSTGHAEMIALREACRKLGRWRLLDCTLYVTLEPCVMCAGALSLSRIQRVVYGAFDPKGGALQSLYQILFDSRMNHRAEVRGGVLSEESKVLLKNFFEKLRQSRLGS